MKVLLFLNAFLCSNMTNVVTFESHFGCNEMSQIVCLVLIKLFHFFIIQLKDHMFQMLL